MPLNEEEEKKKNQTKVNASFSCLENIPTEKKIKKKTIDKSSIK